jgi:hypothetical protein
MTNSDSFVVTFHAPIVQIEVNNFLRVGALLVVNGLQTVLWMKQQLSNGMM